MHIRFSSSKVFSGSIPVTKQVASDDYVYVPYHSHIQILTCPTAASQPQRLYHYAFTRSHARFEFPIVWFVLQETQALYWLPSIQSLFNVRGTI